MKRFIIKTLIYTIIVFVAFAVNFFAVRSFSKFKINNSMLIVGHSITECAFNDSLINNLYNYSASGEAYIYNYHKTKKIIEQNPQINVIFIGFSNNQLSKEMDNWTWDDNHLSYKFPSLGSFLEWNDYLLLFQNNRSGFVKTLPMVLQNNVDVAIKGFRSNVEGGYFYLERDKTDSLVIALDNVRDSIKVAADSENYELSYTNVDYLEKMVNFCKENNIKPYLVRSPLHERSADYQIEPIFQMILSKRFADVEFLDFSEYPLHNSEFGDLEHLNHKGARKFSIWFDQLLKDGLLNKTDKQSFINERINEENESFRNEMINL